MTADTLGRMQTITMSAETAATFAQIIPVFFLAAVVETSGLLRPAKKKETADQVMKRNDPVVRVITLVTGITLFTEILLLLYIEIGPTQSTPPLAIWIFALITLVGLMLFSLIATMSRRVFGKP